MQFDILKVGRGRTNMYVIYDSQSSDVLLIDPGDQPRKIIKFLQERSLTPTKIILTHFHFDHMGAVKKLRKVYGCPVYIHRDDQVYLKKQARFPVWMMAPRAKILADHLLEDGEIIRHGEVSLQVVHTPGHSPGGICLEVVGEDLVFTGDTLFARGVGRFDFKGGCEATLKESLGKVDRWSDQVKIYPGHGRPATMSQVRVANSLFQLMLPKAQ